MPATFVARTAQQTFAKSAGGVLPRIIAPNGQHNVDYTILKTIALHPIVRLGIEVIIGIISKSPWHVGINENSPDYDRFSTEELESIQMSMQTNLDEFRDEILNTALRNQLIYGWQAFERIIRWDENEERFTVKELKPLLQEFTYILTDDAGNYAGIRNIPPTDGKITNIPASELILFNVDVIGQNWYGTPLLLSAVDPYLKMLKFIELAGMLITKSAAVSGVFHYVPGTSDLPDGNRIDNLELAHKLAQGLADNSVVILPSTAQSDHLGNPLPGWKFEPLDFHNSQVSATILENVKHFESLLINALGLPARVVLDGQYGSFSSNQTYRDASYDILQSRLNRFIKVINKQFIDPLLTLNYDAPGLLYIKTTIIDDDSVQNMAELLPDIKDDPDVDKRGVYDQLGIPTTDGSGKYEPIEAIMPQPQLDGAWLNASQLAEKLGISKGSAVSQMKRFKAEEPDFLGIWKGPDSRWRCNSNCINDVFFEGHVPVADTDFKSKAERKLF